MRLVGDTVQDVKIGLVDSQGAFFLFLDEGNTRYLRFSDESEALTELMKKCRTLESENKILKQRVENIKPAVDGMVNVPCAAALLDRHPNYVRQMVRSGKLDGKKLGNQVYVSLSSIESYQKLYDKPDC